MWSQLCDSRTWGRGALNRISSGTATNDINFEVDPAKRIRTSSGMQNINLCDQRTRGPLTLLLVGFLDYVAGAHMKALPCPACAICTTVV